jgi:hypothetical protein
MNPNFHPNSKHKIMGEDVCSSVKIKQPRNYFVIYRESRGSCTPIGVKSFGSSRIRSSAGILFLPDTYPI